MALTSNKLLDARYTELLTTGKVVTPRRAIKYAFGFKEETTPENIRFFGHGGGGPGGKGRQSIFWAPGYGNLEPPPPAPHAQLHVHRLQGKESNPSPATVPQAPPLC